MWRFILVLVFSFVPALALGQGDCAAQAKTEMEKLYCRIAATPEVKSLPSFTDFRRNTPKVQALLLKGPAGRLGLELPGPSKSTASRTNAPTSKPSSNSSSPTTPEKSTPASVPAKATVQTTKKQTANATEKQTKPAATNGSAQQVLASCQFRGEEIRCGRQTYLLQNNQQNQHLQPGVLNADNGLVLSRYSGPKSDTVAVNNYLADSYERYINKMLEIGLGDSTMTYTKFHYTYWELVEKGEDFPGRVGQMFEFLKRDKATMAVKARYDNQLPASIDWCQQLSTAIVVCDDGKKNWVYSN